MRKMIESLAVVAALGIIAFLYVRKLPQPQVSVAQEDMTTIRPINDGHGVYYFPLVGEKYRRALSQFYADNPDLVCEYQGATNNETGSIVYINGHILHCRDSATPAQDTTVS